MKKSCEGCKALDMNSWGGLYLYHCGLDYRLDQNKGIPLEQCPKPKTYQRYFDMKELKEKHSLANEELIRNCQ